MINKMFKTKVLKLKLVQQEQGFTLIDALAGILIMLMFVTVAMQMVAIAALFRSRSQLAAEATTRIQQDLEYVKYQAAHYQPPNTSLAASVGAGASSISVSSTSGFSVNETLKVGSDSNVYKITSISGNTLSIANVVGGTSLQTAQPQYALVVATRCNANSASTGFGDALRDIVNDPSNTSDPDNSSKSFTKISSFTNQQFTLTRTTTPSSTSPFNVLQVSYNVSPISGGGSIAKFYTEVIPNAALQCP